MLSIIVHAQRSLRQGRGQRGVLESRGAGVKISPGDGRMDKAPSLFVSGFSPQPGEEGQFWNEERGIPESLYLPGMSV